jgi:hypothetical protein
VAQQPRRQLADQPVEPGMVDDTHTIDERRRIARAEQRQMVERPWQRIRQDRHHHPYITT